jgi:hypothetical protein
MNNDEVVKMLFTEGNPDDVWEIYKKMKKIFKGKDNATVFGALCLGLAVTIIHKDRPGQRDALIGAVPAMVASAMGLSRISMLGLDSRMTHPVCDLAMLRECSQLSNNPRL